MAHNINTMEIIKIKQGNITDYLKARNKGYKTLCCGNGFITMYKRKVKQL